MRCCANKKFFNAWACPWTFIASWEKGHDEIIYEDALVVELSRAGIPFLREKNYEITYKGVILPHYYYADFVVWVKILFEAKAIEKPTGFARETGAKLPRRLEASSRSVGQLR